MNLWLDQRVGDDIVARSEASFPLETGGLLVGYMTEQGPVVTALIGAGPGATATSTSFLPDAQAQQLELNDIYLRTQGQDTYLGDWHSHPAGLPAMSRRDRRTLASIARHPRARLARPVMLIAAGAQGRWELGGFIAERRFLGVSFDCIAVRMFLPSAGPSPPLSTDLRIYDQSIGGTPCPLLAGQRPALSTRC